MDLMSREYQKAEEQYKDIYAGLISGVLHDQERAKEKLHFLMFGEY